MSRSEAITIGVQNSADDNRTMPHVLELRRLLAEYCAGPYSREIDEFGLVLRIGGCFQEFDFEGCKRIRRNRKQKLISVDLGFPSRHWRGETDEHIRRFVFEAVQAGLLCCLSRLAKDKTDANSEQLLSDLDRVKQLYL